MFSAPEWKPRPDFGALPGSGLGRYHETLHETKKRLIRAAVAEAEGNMTRAAALLGLQPTYLHRLINKLGLRPDLRMDLLNSG